MPRSTRLHHPFSKKDYGRMNEEQKMDVKVLRLKIHKPDKERARRWKELGIVQQQLQNAAWRFWARWHDERGNGVAVREWMIAYCRWMERNREITEAAAKDEPLDKKEKKGRRLRREKAQKALGPKPKCEVNCWPNELGKALYHYLNRSFPDVSAANVSAAMQALRGNMVSRPSSVSAFKRWQRAIAFLGEFESSSRPLPVFIRADQIESPVPPQEKDGDWRIAFKVERDGKRLVRDDVAIQARKPWVRTVLQRILDGEYHQKTGQLLLKKGHWYLHLAYAQPKLKPGKLDKRRVVRLAPSVTRPWDCTLPDGRVISIKGSGGLITWARRSVFQNRRLRSESYREGRNRHGHGRRLQHLENRLSGLKKTFSEQSVAQVVALCVEHNAGTLVFEEPTEANAKTTFLAVAGSWDRPESWPWYLVKSLLKRKCEQAGIILEENWWPGVEGSGKAKTPVSPRGAVSADGNEVSDNGQKGNGHAAGGKVTGDGRPLAKGGRKAGKPRAKSGRRCKG